jgi:uncharacterized protein
MTINVSDIFENVGEYPYKAEISLEELSGLKGFEFVSPISLDILLRNRAGIVTLEYTAKTSLKGSCDRCLKAILRNEENSFEHVLAHSLANGDDNDDYIVVPDYMADMTEIALTDILLEFPSKILCTDDCKGLCPVCGADLNETDCGHTHTEN